MAVKITSGYERGSMTNQLYTITVNGVSIQLEKEDFEELIKELGQRLSDDYNRTKEIRERYMKEVDAVGSLRQDIIKFFYKEPVDFVYLSKNMSELDKEDLFDMLNKHKDVLGFE